MSRPTVEVADIIHAQGNGFVDRHQNTLSFQQLKVLRAISRCRTAALGGHIDECPRCGHEAVSYNSCRDRHCPKCQAQARQRWLTAREQELLEVRYFHVVFSMPHKLNKLVRANPVLLYNLLFRACAETLLEVAADPKHLGAEMGFFCVLHTWGQNLMPHPHLHCVIPAGGLASDHQRWVHPRYRFLLPVKVLEEVFRGKFYDGLKRAYRRKQLRFDKALAAIESPRNFAAFLRRLFHKDWVVYAKRTFGGPTAVLRYLGRYTHRVAISNHRLLDFNSERVTFRWKDYARGGQQRQMTLSAMEFLRRFLQHVLPRGFVRIRYYGFLANHWRGRRLPLCRELLASDPMRCSAEGKEGKAPPTSATWYCPRCGSEMVIRERWTALQIVSRCGFFDSS